MKGIHWTISETEEHYSEIKPEELLYENSATPDTEQQVDYANDISAVFRARLTLCSLSLVIRNF